MLCPINFEQKALKIGFVSSSVQFVCHLSSELQNDTLNKIPAKTCQFQVYQGPTFSPIFHYVILYKHFVHKTLENFKPSSVNDKMLSLHSTFPEHRVVQNFEISLVTASR